MATGEPAPLLYSNMGMLAVLPNGSLAAAWQVRHDREVIKMSYKSCHMFAAKL